MKKLMPLIILASMGMMLYMSWSNTNAYKGESGRQYKKYMESAQVLEEKGIYIDAVKKYESALKVKPGDYETAMKIVSLYDELDDKNGFLSACNAAIKSDSSKAEPYLLSAKKSIEEGDNSSAYEVLKKAEETLGNLDEKPDEALKEISDMIIKIKGEYVYLSCDAEEYFGLHYTDKKGETLARVCYDEKYGLMNGSGSLVKKCEYEDIGLTGSDNLTPVKVNGEYYYIDGDGHKKIVTDRPASYIGVFSDQYAPVEINGTYGYIDKNMNEFHFEYEYAGPFENGVAAVKNEGKWGLISTSFDSKTDFVYEDILRDNYGFCAAFGVFFAKKDGKYNLYDLNGTEIAGGFDDARMFASREPAAVCKNGKWGYVSLEGEIVIEPEYSNAQSFNIGLAPVEVNGKWGCIDMINREIIEPTFKAMLPFSNEGVAYIEQDNIPQMIIVDVYN